MTSSSDASVVERALDVAVRGDDLVVVVGPTASGKTSLAVALAERLGGEIVSADSVQIYRGFDVGSGKPTPEECARAPHHLVGVVDPLAPMDAAAWSRMADDAIADVRSRGRVPIVCGGTFLWVKALLYGLAKAPPASPELRERHRLAAEREGRAALHDRLREVDPASAARLHPNDFVRVSRALEVYERSGRPLSEWHRDHRFASPRVRARLLAIATEPDALTTRIRERVERWLANGWMDEVRGLLASGYGDARAMRSVGYQQVRDAIEGVLPASELAPAITRATRIFARRQRTWLRGADVTWLATREST